MFLTFIIAIQQTNLYSGMFSYCYTEHLEITNRQQRTLIKTKWDCLNYGGEWFVPDLNFDTLANSFQTLSTTASTEGWTQVLWNSIDSTQIDQVPVKDSNLILGVITTFVNFFITSLLFLNLFVGVVVDTFNR